MTAPRFAREARLDEHVAEARAAMACIPRTSHRVMWQADPQGTRAFLATLDRYLDVGGTLGAFCSRLGVKHETLRNLRRGLTPDGRCPDGPPEGSPEGVVAGARIVADLRARVRAAGLKRVEWGRYPDEVTELGRAWLRSGLALTTFARAVNIDPTALRLHLRTAPGNTAREALEDALERIVELEARLADAERRAAEVRR